MEWEGGWEGEQPGAAAGLLKPDSEIFLPPPDINPLGYSKYPLERLIEAAYQGDLELLSKMLDREDPINGYHADLNAQSTDMNALQAAAVNGQLEAVEMLLKAKADPYVKACMPYGRDPKEGETAREMADKFGWMDVVEVLQKAEKASQKGVYMAYGPSNNAKLYPIDKPQGLDPEQERRAKAKHKKMVRPVPNKADRKFYGDLIFGVNFGIDENGKRIKPSSYPYLDDGPAATGPAVSLLFPNEDSIYVGMMGADAETPEVKSIIATAKKVLGKDVKALCGSGPAEKLDQIEVSHTAVLVASIVAHAKLKAQEPEKFQRVRSVAGMGLGEYTALFAAGVLPLEETLLLVQGRAEAILEASKESPQATMSVAGLGKDAVEALCKKVTSKGVCQIASELFPRGVTCAGTASAIEELGTLAKEAGAQQTRILATAHATHTPLMKSATDKLQKLLTEKLPMMSPPTCDIFLNSTGTVFAKGTSPKELIPLLCAQLTSTVKWEASMQGMIAAGTAEFFEVGPMKQLKSMMKRIDQVAWNSTSNIEI
jgi:[acyl-carrier-protein] S-malonyltransferase